MCLLPLLALLFSPECRDGGGRRRGDGFPDPIQPYLQNNPIGPDQVGGGGGGGGGRGRVGGGDGGEIKGMRMGGRIREHY